MNNDDLKAISFREDLIKLLKKYDCEISGTHIDDGGNMNLDFNSGDFSDYIIQGDMNKYNIIKITPEEKWENIMDDYILSCISDTNNTMAGLNNTKVHTCIFTNNPNKAEHKIINIMNKTNKENIKRFMNSKDKKELILMDGTRYTWVKPINASRGYRCSNAIIDRTVTLEELHYVILPICVYCGKDTVEIF